MVTVVVLVPRLCRYSRRLSYIDDVVVRTSLSAPDVTLDTNLDLCLEPHRAANHILANDLTLH